MNHSQSVSLGQPEFGHASEKPARGFSTPQMELRSSADAANNTIKIDNHISNSHDSSINYAEGVDAEDPNIKIDMENKMSGKLAYDAAGGVKAHKSAD